MFRGRYEECDLKNGQTEHNLYPGTSSSCTRNGHQVIDSRHKQEVMMEGGKNVRYKKECPVRHKTETEHEE